MPTNGLPTLLDLKRLDAGIGYNIIEENAKIAPELKVIPADTMAGTEMELTVRKNLPTVQFRNINEGTPLSKSEYETRIFQTHIIDHQIRVDVALVNKAKDKGRFLENHASGVVESAFRYIGRQFYYGVGNDKKGFPGLIAQMASDSTHVFDNGGTTNKTSVWFLSLGRERVEFLFGNDTTINLQGNWQIFPVNDGNGNPYQAYTNWLTGNVGLRVANKNAVVRIKGISDDNGKGLTDALLYKGLRMMYDLGMEPTHIFVRPSSLEQLRNSRTSYNPLGLPAPMTTEFENIPVIRTNSIDLAETI